MTIARSIARPIASPIASRTPIIGGGGGGFEVFVDSVAGNDSNPGIEAEPFATLAAARSHAITNATGQIRMYLKRGSVFRESYEVPDNSYLGAYGTTGPRPVISGITLLEAGGWSKTAGQVNVYQYSISPASETNSYAVITHDRVLMVWDNSVRLGILSTIRTTIQQVDDNANSFFYDAVARILYVRTSDSSDPGANGRTYEASVRTLAVHGGDNVTVEDIHTDGVYARNTVGQQGYGVLGFRSGTYRRCKATRGWNHLIGVANNEQGTILFEECYAFDCEETPGLPSTIYVGFRGGSGDPATTIFRRCVAKQPNAPTAIQTQGFFGHGARSNLVYEECSVENCFLGMSLFNTDSGAIGTIQSIGRHRLKNCTVGAQNDGGRVMEAEVDTLNCATGFAARVDGTIVKNSIMRNANTAVAWFVSSGTIELKDSIVANNPVSVSASSRFAINASSTTRFGKLNNTVVHGCGAAYAGQVTPSASNNNQFSECIRIANATQFSPTFYAVGSIATWRTNSGNDINSTVAAWTAPAGFYDMTIDDPVVDP